MRLVIVVSFLHLVFVGCTAADEYSYSKENVQFRKGNVIESKSTEHAGRAKLVP